MSLFELPPRPLMRDKRTFRDDRLFIVGCDDTYAPKQYFDFFQLVRVHVHVVTTEDGTSTASAVLKRVLELRDKNKLEADDQLWMVIDTDHCIEGNHLAGFMEALGEAARQGVKVALSRPCFEIWLLLHYAQAEEVKGLANAGEVQAALRERLGGEYNKKHLKKEHYPTERVAHACAEAQKLDTAAAGVVPGGNSSRVYMLMKAICEEMAGGKSVCGPSHLCKQL